MREEEEEGVAPSPPPPPPSLARDRSRPSRALQQSTQSRANNPPPRPIPPAVSMRLPCSLMIIIISSSTCRRRIRSLRSARPGIEDDDLRRHRNRAGSVTATGIMTTITTPNRTRGDYWTGSPSRRDRKPPPRCTRKYTPYLVIPDRVVKPWLFETSHSPIHTCHLSSS